MTHETEGRKMVLLEQKEIESVFTLFNVYHVQQVIKMNSIYSAEISIRKLHFTLNNLHAKITIFTALLRLSANVLTAF